MTGVKRKLDPDLAKIEERDPPPIMSYYGSWVRALEPLLLNPNRWFMVRACETPSQAQFAQNNLSCRKVKIPEPTHAWVFASRGCEVFAIYHGKELPRVPKAPSTGRTRTRQQKS